MATWASDALPPCDDATAGLAPAGLAAYWWGVLGPSERRSLSLEKRKGGLNACLAELEAVERRHLNVILQNDEIKVRARPRWQRYDGLPLLMVAPQAMGQTKMRALPRVASAASGAWRRAAEGAPWWCTRTS